MFKESRNISTCTNKMGNIVPRLTNNYLNKTISKVITYNASFYNDRSGFLSSSRNESGDDKIIHCNTFFFCETVWFCSETGRSPFYMLIG